MRNKKQNDVRLIEIFAKNKTQFTEFLNDYNWGDIFSTTNPNSAFNKFTVK